MWSLARRPRWIGLLLLALALAAGFSLLGQWQIERSIATGTPLQRNTETVLPIESIAKPSSPTTGISDGQRASASGTWIPGDYVVVSDRFNGGVSGYWVIGHLASTDASTTPIGLAVARGWAPSTDAAHEAIVALEAQPEGKVSLTGRYLGSEDPSTSDYENGKLSSVAASSLINLWGHVDKGGVYGGYLVDAAAPAGLHLIDSPKPNADISPNWLNIFYAVEWVVFAGFALFLWYRLMKDAWEREQEEAAEAAQELTSTGS
jgi:surfeit locus 1 family protein